MTDPIMSPLASVTQAIADASLHRLLDEARKTLDQEGLRQDIDPSIRDEIRTLIRRHIDKTVSSALAIDAHLQMRTGIINNRVFKALLAIAFVERQCEAMAKASGQRACVDIAMNQVTDWILGIHQVSDDDVAFPASHESSRTESYHGTSCSQALGPH
jgi:hypothetical protein